MELFVSYVLHTQIYSAIQMLANVLVKMERIGMNENSASKCHSV